MGYAFFFSFYLHFHILLPLFVRLLLYGELVSAQDFEHDHLFIHYLVDLPLGWSSTSDSQLTGMTHRCSTKADPKNGKDVAHFSHTFHIDLFFDINRFDLDKVCQ